jgi:hypothetical protein
MADVAKIRIAELSTDPAPALAGISVPHTRNNQTWKVNGEKLAELVRDSIPASMGYFGIRSVEQGVTADQATKLIDAMESGYVVDGQGMTYNFEGNLAPAAGSFKGLRNVKLKLQDQDATNRSLYLQTQTHFILHNALVEGDDDRVTGSIGNTGLIWIDDCENFTVDGIRATKGGPGSGVSIQASNSFSLANTRVWDMNYDVAAATDDVVQGIWLNNCSDFSVINPQAFDFTGEIANVASRRFTRGVVFGGCSRWSLHGGFNRTVDQGLDLTGSVGNEDFTIVGHNAYDSFTYGLKFANTARDGKIIGCTSVLAGGAGFTVSPSDNAGTDDADEAQRLLFLGCRARNPGGSAVYSGHCGFSITLGAHSTTYPQGIEFRDCEAIDDRGGSALMKYGAVNEIVHPAATGFRRNVLTNFKSAGHALGASIGFHSAFASVIGTSAGGVNDSTWTDLDFSGTDVEDTSSMHNPASNANQITVREAGVYEIVGLAAFAANATGIRGIKLRIDGTDVNQTITHVPAIATAATETTVRTSYTVRLADGQIVSFRVWQNSGGSLNVNRANSTATVRKVAD